MQRYRLPSTRLFQQQQLSTDNLLEALRTTVPLSTTRAEEIQQLRSWARERAVPALLLMPAANCLILIDSAAIDYGCMGQGTRPVSITQGQQKSIKIRQFRRGHQE